MGAPRRLYQELGHITATWAEIEQHLLLTRSALTSKPYGGIPTGDLRERFTRLRKAWLNDLRKNYPKEKVDKIFQPINMRLAKLAIIRGDLIHGTWSVRRSGVYVWSLWEQRGKLVHKTKEYTLIELNSILTDMKTLLYDIDAACR